MATAGEPAVDSKGQVPMQRGVSVGRARMTWEDRRRQLRRLAPTAAKQMVQRLLWGYVDFTPSFSSAGEDMIVRNILGTSAGQGFYVDVGAHHPTNASNTCHFRWLGWRGINIEPQPDLWARFQAECPRDINLQLAIGTTPGSRTLYVADDGAKMASFHAARASLRRTPLRSFEVEVQTLATVLDTHLPKDQRIDFLNVDAEGADLEVLSSNDWDRYRPRVVCVETTAKDRTVPEYLVSCDYRIVATNSIILDEIVEVFGIDNSFDWKTIAF